MNTLEIIQYYANLLILQYLGKTKAYATIETVVNPVVMPQVSTQELTFSLAPIAGSFILSYNGNAASGVQWNDSAGTIQSKLRALSGLSSVTVSGSIASKTLTVTFTGVTPPAFLLTVSSNTLVSSAVAVLVSVTETDLTLPLAVQNAFNVTGNDMASGVQLDVIGKYAGVSRNGYSFTGAITLNDADFRTLIQLAIVTNNAGSSLSDIQNLLHEFFPNEVLVFDDQDMQMSYLVSTSIGSLQLVEMAIINNLLPKPMGVQLASVIYAPNINQFFGFRTYSLPGFNIEPFNTYGTYHMDWPWLTYQDAILT